VEVRREVGQATNILLTGTPGVGKTTAIRKTLKLLRKVRIGGFFTEAIEEAGRRTGFSITDLAGPKGVLASVRMTVGPRVGRYRVNVRDLERIGVPALLGALQEADLIVCDEIGRMELFCPEFRQAVLRCLDSPKPVFGTIQARRNEFLDGIRARDDVDVIQVTHGNRDGLPAELVENIQQLRRSP